MLGELGRSGRRAAIHGEAYGIVERGGDDGILGVLREREVKGPQDGVLDQPAIRAWTRRRLSPRSR